MAAPIDQNKLNTLIKQRDTLESDQGGMEYMGGGLQSGDVKRTAQLKNITDTIDKMKSQQQSEKWYGSTAEDTGEGAKQNLTPFTRLINTVNTPLYGVVGGIKGALGMNNGKGILESAWENADWTKGGERQTAGDVMREAGLPNVLAAPAGFMADVALDPVTWATMGLSALVPRVGVGFAKAAIKEGSVIAGLSAAKSGALSRMGQLGLTALDYTKYIPGLKGGLVDEATGAVKGGLRLAGSDWAKELSSNVVEEYGKYNKLLGRDPLAEMGKGLAGQGFRTGDIVRGAIEDYVPYGKDITRVLEYSPEKFADMSDYYNSIPGLQNTIETSISMADDVEGEAHLIDFLVDNKDKVVSSGLVKELPTSAKPFAQGIKDSLLGYVKDADTIANGTVGAILDVEQRGKSMLDVTHETMQSMASDLREAQKLKEGMTGVHWYDKLSSKTSNFIKDKLTFGNQVRSDMKADVLKALEDSKLSGTLSADELTKVDIDITNLKKWKGEAEELTKFKATPVEGRSEADIAKFTEMTSGKTPTEKILSFEKKYRQGNMTTGEKFIRSMDFFTDMFKLVQVGTSPAAMMNAIVGNPAMMMAAGIEMRPELLTKVYEAFNLSRGKGGPDVVWKLFLSNEDFLRSFAAKDSKLQMATGQSVEGLLKDFVLNSSLAQAKKAGLLSAVDDNEIREAYYAMKDDLKELARKYQTGQISRAGTPLGEDVARRVAGTVETSALSEVTSKAFNKGEALNMFNSPTGFIPNEISSNDSYLRDVKDYFKNQAASGSKLHKVMNFGINGLSGIFEGIDQTYKLGLALHLTNNGLTEAEMRVASKTYPKILEAVTGTVDKLGGTRYKIGWNKAIDFSNEVFMNYAAMPPAVKLLRSIPIIGSPFVSFSYAMLPKFGKAVVHNPAFFNKVDFAIKEFSGQKDAVEREALKSKYASMFNSPGMVKLPDIPFFKSYPMYLNIMNWNPFMSMSILGDTQRRYSDDAIGQVAGMIDQLGIMQNPVGQLLKDVIILPAIMGQEYENQNRFGQRVYPEGSTAFEKAGYVAKDMAGSFLPKPLSMLAAPFIPESISPDLLPDQLGGLVGAIRGQSKKGVIKKDDAPIGLAAREYMKGFGTQVYPLDESFARQSAKK